jgi:hypothetical protein
VTAGRIVLGYVAYAVLAAIALLTIAIAINYISLQAPDATAAGPPADARLTAIGRAYMPELGRAYAAAWEAGARDLDAGKPIGTAIGTVGTTWSTGRSALYDRTITPALKTIVPEGTADVDVTAGQRAAMAAAFRGLAAGVSP